MKVKLNFMERTRVSGFIPVESDRVTMRIARELREELSFNADEIEKYHIRTTTDTGGQARVFWSPEGNDVVREFDIINVMTDKIFDELEKLEKSNKTTSVDIDLWDKFEFEKRKLKIEKKE